MSGGVNAIALSHVAVQQSKDFCAVQHFYEACSTNAVRFHIYVQRDISPVQLLFTLKQGSGCHDRQIHGRPAVASSL
jgi:hypothetical protein